MNELWRHDKHKTIKERDSAMIQYLSFEICQPTNDSRYDQSDSIGADSLIPGIFDANPLVYDACSISCFRRYVQADR